MSRLEERNAHVHALLEHDNRFAVSGLVVAGMDEAGRGPLVGPVVTACVIMPLQEEPILWVDDSKKLSETRREKVYEEILAHALAIGIGSADAEEIDQINILQATKNAMRRAAKQISADIYLIDAVTDLGLSGKEIPIIHGDALSYSIAAASIVAKVTRDRQLAELDSLYPVYGFKKNKGYGTKEHIAALQAYGPCPLHRKTFIKNLL
ncbi:MAG: ribonuclease HII [Clostridia bacterium]|nr:ribonuclease HII [Clostridia bacterium]